MKKNKNLEECSKRYEGDWADIKLRNEKLTMTRCDPNSRIMFFFCCFNEPCKAIIGA